MKLSFAACLPPLLQTQLTEHSTVATQTTPPSLELLLMLGGCVLTQSPSVPPLGMTFLNLTCAGAACTPENMCHGTASVCAWSSHMSLRNCGPHIAASKGSPATTAAPFPHFTVSVSLSISNCCFSQVSRTRANSVSRRQFSASSAWHLSQRRSIDLVETRFFFFCLGEVLTGFRRASVARLLDESVRPRPARDPLGRATSITSSSTSMLCESISGPGNNGSQCVNMRLPGFSTTLQSPPSRTRYSLATNALPGTAGRPLPGPCSQATLATQTVVRQSFQHLRRSRIYSLLFRR